MKKFLQKQLSNFLAKHLYNCITEDDILQVYSRNKVIYKGRNLPPDQISKISDNARMFKNSLLWGAISDEVKQKLNYRMYVGGKSDEDLLAGKIGLYILEIIERKIQELSNLK